MLSSPTSIQSSHVRSRMSVSKCITPITIPRHKHNTTLHCTALHCTAPHRATVVVTSMMSDVLRGPVLRDSSSSLNHLGFVLDVDYANGPHIKVDHRFTSALPCPTLTHFLSLAACAGFDTLLHDPWYADPPSSTPSYCSKRCASGQKSLAIPPSTSSECLLVGFDSAVLFLRSRSTLSGIKTQARDIPSAASDVAPSNYTLALPNS